MQTKLCLLAIGLVATVALQGCKHPLAIVGEGDIVDVNNSGRGCTLEQFRAQDTACTENEVNGDYFVNYKAAPRPGWRFVRWDGPCSPRSAFQHCRQDFTKATVDWWEDRYPHTEIPPSTAVFAPITGKTGYLLAGTPVAGVTYKTRTQQGVTGLDGSFQYEEGENVRFKIGGTQLGAVSGRAQVTPFDLAGSPVFSSVQVSLEQNFSGFTLWGDIYPPQAYALQQFNAPDTSLGQAFFHRPDPFDTVINISVLLQSLDEDANPGNGIVIRPGVTGLFQGVSLDLRPQESSLPGYMEGAGSPGGFPTLHYQLARANNKRLFKVAHGMIGPAVALQRLYESLGIDSRTYATCPGGWDFDDSKVDCRYDANGNLTWLQLESGTVARYEYDPNSNRTRQETGGQILTWQYDALGNLVRATRDDQGDGNPGSVESWQYDQFGNITRYEEDDGADSTIDQFETWQYDAQGKPTRAEWSGPDPREGHTKSWQYHTNGKLKKYEEAFTVNTNGHDSTHTQIWQYDASGRLRRYRQDNEDTEDIGVLWVTIETREYDEQGNLWVKHYSGEESPSSLVGAGHFQFDADGKLVRYTQDNNDDGKREQLQTWQYDAKGNVVRHMRDDGYNSEPDYIETWQYDANSKPVRAEGSDASGRLVYTRTWGYDTIGKLTRYTQDGSSDVEGHSDPAGSSVQTWQYNAAGNLTQHKTERADGETLIDNWLYDNDGNVARFERNHDRLGMPGQIESWRFHTTGWGHLFSGPNIWWLYF